MNVYRNAQKTVHDALLAEYGHGKGAARRLARDAHVSLGAAENWLANINSPKGDSLIRLMAASDRVFETVLHLAGRSERLDAIKRDEAVRDFLGKIGA